MKLNKLLPFTLLIILSVVFNKWLFSVDIFTKGDWGYFFIETLTTLRADYFSVWLSDFDFGRILLDAGQALSYGGAGILAKFFNVDWLWSTRLLYFYPSIFIGSFSMYFLARRLLNSELAGFVASVVFSFNTYFLVLKTGHLTLSTSFALSPLVFYFYYELLKSPNFKKSALFSISFFIASSYEPRGAYVIALLLAFYTIWYSLFSKETVQILYQKAKWVVISSTFFVSFNLFWLVGLTNINGVSDGGILTRELWGSQYYDIRSAMTLFHPWWTGGEVSIFIKQQVPVYFYFIPIFAILGIFLNRKNNIVLFFGIVSLVGILLTKQASQPFPELYLWLFKNFPGFVAFREASKFFFLIAFSYSILIASFVSWLWSLKESKFLGKNIKISTTLFVVLLFLFNTKPIITQEINSLFVKRTIPEDYLVLKALISKDYLYSRIMWVPRDSRWGFYTNSHSKTDVVGLINSKWKDFVTEKFSFDYPQKQIMDIFSKKYASHFLNISSIKYLIVPLRDIKNDDDFYLDYGGREMTNIRGWYIDELDKLSYIKKIDIGTKELVVYENENYGPHIDAITSLIKLDSFENLDDKYSFILDHYKKDVDFYIPNSTSSNLTLPSINLSLLYENANIKSIRENKLTENKIGNQNSKVYANSEKAVTYFVPNKDGYKIEKGYEDKLVINSEDLRVERSKELYTSENKKTLSYIKVGSELIKIDNNSTSTVLLGSSERNISLLSSDNTNIITNGSFEHGLWQEKVGDCNNYDDNGDIAQNISNIAHTGKNSLELEATRHNACTGPDRTKIGGGEYILSFAYQSDNAREAGYYMSVHGATTTVISEKLPISGNDWNVYRKHIIVPSDAENFSLSFYSYAEDNVTPIKVRYDDVSLEKASIIKEIVSDITDNFSVVKSSLTANSTFELQNDRLGLNNLIINYDLSAGLWSKKVGDCNNYDDNGSVAQYLVDDVRDNGKSLQLEALRHTACTGPKQMKVKEAATYMLSFDYKSDNAKEAGLYVGYNGTSTENINERIQVKNKNWSTYTKLVKIPLGVTSVSMSVYAYEKDGEAPVKVNYDNFYFAELPEINNKYYLLTDSDLKLEKPKQITFDLINPTKKLTHIVGASTPFYLTMSESYHPQWQAELNNRKVSGKLNSWIPFVSPDIITEGNHFKLDGFLNGWYIDPVKLCLDENKNVKEGCKLNEDGSYDIEMIIEFTPQRWFYVGLIISVTTLVSCITYLLYSSYKSRRLKRIEAEKLNAWYYKERKL